MLLPATNVLQSVLSFHFISVLCFFQTFLDSRSATVLGRDKLLNQIEDYVCNGNKSRAPLLVVGIAGAGKSALMAKSAHRATELVEEGKILNMEG